MFIIETNTMPPAARSKVSHAIYRDKLFIKYVVSTLAQFNETLWCLAADKNLFAFRVQIATD